MELKDQVQGVVLGLFGAYAGGYFADLTAQAETADPVALVSELVNLQKPLLGVDLSDDSTWVDTILAHLGISSTSSAYTAAAAWANGELDAGASRAAVIIYAVNYLLGDSVDAQYADVATAFKADVAAGVEYSEGAGAEVLEVGELREAAGNPATGTSFNLTAALEALAVEEAALAEFIASDDLADADDSLGVDAGTDVSEAEADAYLNAEVTAAAGVLGLTSTTTAGQAAEIAADRAALEAGVAEETAITAELEADITALGLLTKLKAHASAQAAAVAAAEAEAAAGVDVAAAKLAVEGKNTIVSAVDGDGNITDGTDIIISFDADDGYAVATDGAELIDIQVWVDALNAEIAAVEASDLADSKEASALTVLETAIGDLSADDRADLVAITFADYGTDVTDTDAAIAADLIAQYDDQIGETGAQTVAEEALATFEENLADYEAAAELLAAFEALVESRDDAVTAIEDEGYNIEDLGAGGIDTATTDEADLFTIGTAAIGQAGISIDNFGLLSDDLIYVGSDYVLGTDIDAGNNSALEVFIEQDGINTIVTIELAAFGTSADTPELFEVELTGVQAADVSFSNGYIQLA